MRLRIAEFRDQLNMSQQELAERLGVSPKTEWNWENGKSFPNVEQLCRMCDMFSTDPNTLMGWYEAHPSASQSLSADQRKLVEDYSSLTPSRRVIASELMEDMAARSFGCDGGSGECDEAMGL